MENALEKFPVGHAADAPVDLVDTPGRPGVHGRVDVAEGPLVGGNLPVRVHVPLAQEEHELRLGELGIHEGHRDHVEGEVPGGIPRVLPLVRHGDDVLVVQMRPLAIPSPPASGRRGRLGGIAGKPSLDVVVVELSAPQHAGQGLPHDQATVGGQRARDDEVVELVRVSDAAAEDLLEVETEGRPRPGRIGVGESEPERDLTARRHTRSIPGRRLGAHAGGVDGIFLPRDHALADAVLDIRRAGRHAEEPWKVGLVLGEEQLGRALGVEPSCAERLMSRGDHRLAGRGCRRLKLRPGRSHVPGPRIAKPEGGQEVELGRLRTAVDRGHPDQQIVDAPLGVLHGDVEVPVAVEDVGVEQLVLGLRAPSARVLLDEAPIGKGRLRVLVQAFHVRMRGRGIEVEVVFLHVLAVIALGIS